MKCIRLLFFSAVILWAHPAGADNFSYTYLEVGSGKIWLKDDRIVSGDASGDVSGDAYDAFYLFFLSGAGQLDNGIVIGGDALLSGNKGADTWVATWEYTLTGSYPVNMTKKIDIIPQLGFASTRMVVCIDGKCDIDNDIGLTYGIGLRAWVVPEKLEISADWNDSTSDLSDSAFRLGGALWWRKNHSVRLTAMLTDDQGAAGISYRYTAFWK